MTQNTSTGVMISPYLARPDWKNNWKVTIFHLTWMSLLPQRRWMD